MKTRLLNSTLTTTTFTRSGLAALTVMSLLASILVLRAADNNYVAHEWGTFTSIQGRDGVLLDWNGIATSDLPPFVYNWSRAGLQRFNSSYFSKGSISSLQRMETPVIYFYAKKPLNLDVAVEFPKGHITEWFPQAEEVGPSFRPPGRILATVDKAASRAGVNPSPSLATLFGDAPVTNSIIHWKNFEVLPAKQHSGLASKLPASTKPSHYFAARTKDAAFVRVNSLEPANPAPEIEKFLFYRGVGNFQTPLKVTMDEVNQITVANAGDAPLKHLFAIAINGDRATVVPLGNLAAGQILNTPLDAVVNSKPAASAVKELRQQVAGALESEGLYRAEAEAMVNTWRDAWFEDQGVRVLYVLPRAWTDSILPITLKPQPRELVRVMVGRAEVITPAMEQQICKCVESFRQSDPVAKQAAISGFRAMKLGRFAPVALRLAGSHQKDAKFFEQGSALIEAAAKPEVTEAARRSAGVSPAGSSGVSPEDAPSGETPLDSQPGTAALPARRLPATGG